MGCVLASCSLDREEAARHSLSWRAILWGILRPTPEFPEGKTALDSAAGRSSSGVEQGIPVIPCAAVRRLGAVMHR